MNSYLIKIISHEEIQNIEDYARIKSVRKYE